LGLIRLPAVPGERCVVVKITEQVGTRVVLVMDRVDGTLEHTRAAVDTLVGIDEHLHVAELAPARGSGDRTYGRQLDGSNDAVAGAHVDACGVAGADAGTADEVRHASLMSKKRRTSNYLKMLGF
jgi:hypothetical protein